uniref:Amidohydrolase-related domain-containing protein n=1 Tax=Meloidogyne incognita TaxID=6306 RepID=A0A914LZV3_MELIC
MPLNGILNNNNILINTSLNNGFNNIYTYSNKLLNKLLKNSRNGEIICFCNAKIFKNGEFLDKQSLSRVNWSQLFICNGKVIETTEKPNIFVDCEGLILAPGFIDIQLNGAFGIDFTQICTENFEENEKENIQKMEIVKNKLLKYGVTSFCPTIITSQQKVYFNCLKLIEKMKTLNYERISAQIIEIGSNQEIFRLINLKYFFATCAHFEGPFINPKRAGCHPTEYIIPINNPLEIDLFYSLNSPSKLISNLSIVTLAPELENSEKSIKLLNNKNIRVCIGHSNADMKVGENALDAGATGITHLFCAMAGFHHRKPGIIDLLLSTKTTKQKSKQIYYGIIADGVHISETSIQLAFCLNPNGAMLVTDGISALGLNEGKHLLGNKIIKVEGRKATVDGTDILAGSVASMIDCIKLFSSCIEKRHENRGFASALKAATFTPANFLGIQQQKGTLIAGSDADFVLIDERRMEIIATFIGGIKCFDSIYCQYHS